MDTLPAKEFQKIFDRMHRKVDLSRVKSVKDIEDRLRRHPKFDDRMNTLLNSGFAVAVVKWANAMPNSRIGRIVRGLPPIRRPPRVPTIRYETWVVKGVSVERTVYRDAKGRFAKKPS